MLQLQLPEFLRPVEVEAIENTLVKVRRSCSVERASRRERDHLIAISVRPRRRASQPPCIRSLTGPLTTNVVRNAIFKTIFDSTIQPSL